MANQYAQSVADRAKFKLVVSLIIILLILAVALTLYFSGRKAGVKKASAQGNKGKLPEETDWGKGQNLTPTEILQIKHFADALFEDMDGINWFSRDVQLYREYLASSDRVFVGTANYFFDNYGRGDNLAVWLDKEWFKWQDLSSDQLKKSVVQRLAEHGIKA